MNINFSKSRIFDINLVSSLVSEWIDYQTQQTKLKEYEPKQVEINDAIKHTLDKLSK